MIVANSAYFTALIAFLSALVTTLITQLFIGLNFRREIKNRYRKTYFEKQLEAYQELWSCLRPLSRYRGPKIIFEGVSNIDGEKKWILNINNSFLFCESVTDFYFSHHGLLLSRKVRDLIFELRGLIGKQIVSFSDDRKLSIALEKSVSKEINRLCGEIFEAVRADVGLLNLQFDIKEFGIHA